MAVQSVRLQVKVVSTSRYLSTVVEVYAYRDKTRQIKKPAAPNDKPKPCVTAHSVNLSTLPHAGIVSQGSSSPFLKAEECMRAFVIRDRDKDWAVLIGPHYRRPHVLRGLGSHAPTALPCTASSVHALNLRQNRIHGRVLVQHPSRAKRTPGS